MVVVNTARGRVVEAWCQLICRVPDAVVEDTRLGFLFIVPQFGAIRLNRRVALFAQPLDHAYGRRQGEQEVLGKSSD